MKTLLNQAFVRVPKSYMVAMDKIEYIERNRVVISKEYIPVRETYKKAFFDRVS
jgi:two-component system LytT family response regulator